MLITLKQHTSFQDGNWFDASTWSIGGIADSDSDGRPDANDNVIINGHIVSTTNANNTVKNITINSGSTLQISTGTYLDFWGNSNFTNNGNIIGDGKIYCENYAVLNGSGSWSSTLDFTFLAATLIDCSLNFGGDIEIYGKSQVLTGNTCIFLSGMTIGGITDSTQLIQRRFSYSRRKSI